MQEIWHYKDDNKLITRAFNEFIWQSAFLNTSVNDKGIFNNTILYIIVHTIYY